MMVAIVGEGGLTPPDRRALVFADAFERELVGQAGARRTLAETVEIGWRLLDRMPVDDLLKLSDEQLAARRAPRLVAESRPDHPAKEHEGEGRSLPVVGRPLEGGRAGRTP